MKPLVSIIILNWNRKQDSIELIQSLKKQTYKNFEVLLVDNASTDGSREVVQKLFPEVKLIPLNDNVGISGFTSGMQFAKGEYYLLLANDALLEPDVVAKHIEKLRINQRLGISCASTYLWPSKKYIAPNRAKTGDNIKGYTVTYFDGNGICLRKDVFDKTGGYAKDYFICLEELEWAVRVLRAGYDIRCFTDIVVYNKKTETDGNYRSTQGYWYARNWLLFYARYLTFSAIQQFIKLHLKSFFNKTTNSGTMRKRDVFTGLLAGTILIPKTLLKRDPLPETIINRLKLDLFPNNNHLYIE